MTIIIDTSLDGQIDSWDELKSSISEETDGRADQAQLAAYIRRAEARIRRALAMKPIRPMQTSVGISFTGETLIGPADMVLPQSVELVDGDNRFEVDYVDPDNLASLQSSNTLRINSFPGSSGGNYPRYFTMIGDTLRFWPAQPAALTGTLYYFQELPPLSADNQTNWLLVDHSDVYLDGSLYYAYRGMPDIEKASLMKNIFEQSLSEALEAYPVPANRVLMGMDPMLTAQRLYRGVSAY